MRRIRTLILVLACVACVMGENLLVAEGRLDADASDCTVRLTGKDGMEAHSYYTRKIKAEFRESFTIAPALFDDYRIIVACPGYRPTEKTVRTTSSKTQVDFGTIRLSR
jgi:hypothetical protein